MVNAMPNLLVVQASPRSASSVSRRLAAAVVDRLNTDIADLRIIDRDLATQPLPGLTHDATVGMFLPTDQRSPAHTAALKWSNMLIEELHAADAIVLASPMYNYNVTTQLKAWIDQVVMPGVTFSVRGGRFEGMLADRPVLVITSSGGEYGNERSHEDFHTPYLRHILGFVGLHDLRFVQAEALSYDPERGIAAANESLDRELGAFTRAVTEAVSAAERAGAASLSA